MGSAPRLIGGRGPRKGGLMARADPTRAFRGYQDEVWQLMRRGAPLGGVEEAIEQTEVDEEQKVALWLLAFSLSDPDQPHAHSRQAPDQAPEGGALGRHLAVVR